MCNNRCGGCLIAIAIGIIVGILVGIFFFLGLIPRVTFALISAVIFGAIALMIATFISAFGKKNVERCVCFKGRCVLVLALLSILVITMTLSFTLIASIGTAILVAISTALFIATLIATFQLVSCAITANCNCREIE